MDRARTTSPRRPSGAPREARALRRPRVRFAFRALVGGASVGLAGLASAFVAVACSSEGGDTVLDAELADEDASVAEDAGRGGRPTRDDDATVDTPPPPPPPPPVKDASLADVFDAGVCPDPGSPNLAPALQGAPAYAASFGPTARSASHGGNPNPAGRACINCHNPGGSGRAFFFAGTVAPKPLVAVPNDAGPDGGDAGTTKVDAGVFPIQVVVREAQGRLLSVTTDQDGNFFFEAKADAGACISTPLRAAIRRDSATKVMQNQRTSGNCNGCHTLVAP